MNAGSIADPYLTDRAYRKGDLVMNNGYLYSALTDMDAGEWDETKWLRTNVAAALAKKEPIKAYIEIYDNYKGTMGERYVSIYDSMYIYTFSLNLKNIYSLTSYTTIGHIPKSSSYELDVVEFVMHDANSLSSFINVRIANNKGSSTDFYSVEVRNGNVSSYGETWFIPFAPIVGPATLN